MTNKEIRRRAWELCREKFGLILSATFLLSLISTLGMNLVTAMNSSAFSLLIGIALTIVSTIMSIGVVRFVLDIWHGEIPALSVLFSQKHRFLTFICYQLLLTLIVVVITVGFMMAGMILYSNAALIIGLLLAIIVMLWMVLRFEMAITCIVIRPSFRTTECMRTAWHASKGNVWRLLCNEFILGIPLFIAQGLLTGYQTYLMMTGQMLNDVGSILLDAGTVLISALLSGYIYLGTYSLHEHLLEQYFAANPEQSSAELWNAPAEAPALLEDEYEDIPEDEKEEEENNSPEN